MNDSMCAAARLPQRLQLLLGVVLSAALQLGGAARGLAQIEHPAVARAMEISDAFKAVADEARPSVARITGYSRSGAKVTGSGFVIDNQGRLLTNNHVVETAVSLIAEFSDGRVRPATLVGADPLTDLAVIKVNDPSAVPLPFSSAESLQVGEWVVAVGFPLGLDQTVTVGVISATNRKLNIVGSATGQRGYEDFIQTDAAINRGNSGGPLLNLRGEVVGVNSAIVTQTGGSDGLGFAIPTKLANYISRELIDKGRVVRAWLGVGLQDLTPSLSQSYGLPREQTGAMITSVRPGDPAGNAGLATEDIITSIDGRVVHDVEDLRNQIAMLAPGKRIVMEVFRNSKPRTFEVVLGEMSGADSPERPVLDPDFGGRLGVVLQDLAPVDLNRLRETNGVMVTQLVPGRPAQLNGVRDGDVIVAVNGEALRAVRDRYNARSSALWLIDSIEKAAPGTILRFTVRRALVDSSGMVVGYDHSFVAVEMP